jgi:4-hydroxybutyrate dehydrogenase
MRPPTLSYLTDVYLGLGARAVLPELLSHLGVRRPLVVTDRGLLTIGLVDMVPVRAAAVFSDVDTNPTEASVAAGAAAFRAAECDGLVAVGGGAPIDAAKLVGLLVHHPLPLERYAILESGGLRITARLPPLVAVPTTAGSGSEVGRAALVRLASGRKVGILSTNLLPKAAVCDAELTFGLPPRLTAATGMDALSHCVETLLSPRENPVAEAIALDGLSRGWAALPRAVADGRDGAARQDMMLASVEGGLAFQKGLGAVHSLSHALGGHPRLALHHGTLNALFLPHVLRFNHDGCPAKMQAIADRLRLGRSTDVADAFARRVEELGLPTRLRDLGLEETELEGLAPVALADHCTATNPRPLDVASCLELYRAAW